MDVVSDALTDNPEPVLVMVEGDPEILSIAPDVQLDLSKFPGGRWALQLDAAFARRTTPAIIVARGVACLAVAWWAQLSPHSYLKAVRGAAFRSPLHVGFGQAAIAARARTGPMRRLPFPSVVGSEATSYVEQVLALADQWGSRFVDPGMPPSGLPSNGHGPATEEDNMLLRYFELLNPGAHRAGTTATQSPVRPISSVEDNVRP